MKNLKNLNVSGNEITKEFDAGLFNDLNNLENLRLNGVKLTNLDSVPLNQLKKLKSLCLSKNNFISIAD